MTGQHPGTGWRRGTDGRWYPPQPQQWESIPPELPEKPRKEAGMHNENRDNSSYVESMKALQELLKALQELLKTIQAFMAAHKIISGVGITIVIVVVIGTIHHTINPAPARYSAAVQQSWLNDCESRSFNTIPKCECELSYFEDHVSATVFEQDYSAMPPGVVPAQLAGAEACPS